jgi:protein-tyrosine phosphatase
MRRGTDEDAAHLRSLGIRTICDFRRRDERQAEPTLWHEASDTAYWSRDYTEQSGILASLMRDPSVDAAQLRDTMVAIYDELLHDHEASYRAMFDALAEGRSPLLINCAAGKDRTGVGAALVLLALGVSREDVVADYLLTNDLCDWNGRLSRETSAMARLYMADPERLRPLLCADADYLDKIFVALETRHGGVEAYLAGRLGVDAAKLERIRLALTQEAA